MLQKARRFFVSPWGLFLQFCLASLVVVFHAQTAGLVAFAMLLSALLALCDDILATLPPFLFTTLFLIQVNGNLAVDKFLPFWWLILPAVGCTVFHLIAYQREKKWERGRAFWPLLAAAAAITLGGLGFISLKEYFSATSLYHVGALGFGMLLTYAFLFRAVPNDKEGRLPGYLSNVMLTMGLLACFMVFHLYIERLPWLRIHGWQVLEFQWRNNVSTFLMLALPFPFYKALKRPAYLLTGLLMYLAILLTGSRGGLLFGTAELALCVLYVLLADKKRRWFYLGLVVVILILIGLSLPLVFNIFWGPIKRILLALLKGENEVRTGLWRRAVQDFLHQPVFGTGMGYMGNRDIHPSKAGALCWYHCAPLQVIGSMGLVGVAAYGWLFVARARVYLRRRTHFHWTLLLSWVGLELMSLVNPGIFAPLPYCLLITIFLVFAEKTEEAGEGLQREPKLPNIVPQ
ncbi:MAG: O-antigen ligase family protein [Oscillospiraceae bacterium]|jgi:hypothetical protein|nr:O-antigen ligase family protein [Oscillospiraceae bacterium]